MPPEGGTIFMLRERRGGMMTPEERIANMTKAIQQAIKVMGDRFGSTEGDVARAIEALKVSLQAPSPPISQPVGQSVGQPVG